MLCWAVCNTVFFSFSWSNWCYYSLPIYPALSILTAQFLLDVAHKFPSRTIIRISLAIVATFFFAATVYALTFLQLKAKHDGYLKFAGYVNEIPSRIPFFFHSNLNGQYLLVDHIVFETGRMPLCCSQDSLMKRLFSFTPFVALLPRYDFENLPPSCKAKLKIVDIETLKWINFPGCALAKQAPIGKPISLVLASHNCDIGTFISDSLMPLPIKDKQSLASDSSEQFANQHSKIDGLATWWLAKAYFKDQEPPDIVILGDSSLGSLAGADSYVYNKEVDPTGDHRSYTIEQDLKLLLHKNWHVFVGALPEGMVSDQLITSWALFSSKYKPRMVVVMLSPRNFIDYTCPPATSTEPYAFFSSHINIKAPFKSLGTALHAKTHTQISPLWLTKCLENGLTENLEKPSNYSQNFESNSPLTFGRPFERIAPGEIKITSSDGFFFDDNIPKYKEIYKKPYSPQLYFQLDCLDVLFKYLKQQHIAAIAAEMPLTNSNHILLPESFWEFYHNRVNSICRKNEVDYWDTESIWNDFPKTEFCDSAHLGLRGGLKLARPIVLGTAYTLHLPMYAYNGNFGPLVPGKEKIYFHRTWTGAQELSVHR